MASVTSAGSNNTEVSAQHQTTPNAPMWDSANPNVVLVRKAVEFLFQNGMRDPAKSIEEHVTTDLKNTLQKQRSYQQVWRDCNTLFRSRLEAPVIMGYAALHGVNFIQVDDVDSNDGSFERSVSSELQVTPEDAELLHKVTGCLLELERRTKRSRLIR